MVCLISKMVKAAPAQMANRLTKNATEKYRPNLSNGASVRALSTTSRATLASMAATDAIERKASWIIEGHYIPSITSIPGLFSCPYSPSFGEGRLYEVRPRRFLESS